MSSSQKPSATGQGLKATAALGIFGVLVVTGVHGINAVGAYVPVDERPWAGAPDAAGMLLASHQAAKGTTPAPAPLAILPSAPDEPAGPEGPDLSGLYTFAEQGDDAGVAREIARIRLTHPDFDPPRLPTPGAARPDEDAVWAMLAQGDVEAARHEIAVREARYGTYVPSPALERALVTHEARRAINASAAAGRWAEVMAAAARAPELMVCAEMQVLWHVAEAAARSGDAARASEIYRTILRECENLEERQATVYKASELLTADELEALIPAGAPGHPEVASVLSEMQNAQLRIAIGDWLADKTPKRWRAPSVELVAADGAGEPIKLQPAVLRRSPEEARPAEPTFSDDRCRGPFDWTDPNEEPLSIDEIARAAERATPSDPAAADAAERLAAVATSYQDQKLLGWYHHMAQNYADAVDWFERSVASNETAEALTGLVLAKRDADDRDGALLLAKEKRDVHIALACLYLQMAAQDLEDGSRASRPVLEELTVRLRSADAAQRIGWLSVSEEKVREGHAWFERSVEWEPSETGVLGLAVTHERMGNRKAVARLAKEYGKRYPQVAFFARSLEGDKSAAPKRRPKGEMTAEERANAIMEEALAAFRGENYARALELLDQRQRYKAETQDITMLRGWTLYHLGRLREAYNLFREQDQIRSTRKTRHGVVVAWRRMMPWRFH